MIYMKLSHQLCLTSGLQVAPFWNFCLHINFPYSLHQSESYTCPEVSKGGAHRHEPPPIATTTKKQRPWWRPACHHPLRHKKKTHLNLFQVHHRGSLQWQPFSRSEFQVASFEARSLQTPGTIWHGTGSVTRNSHLDPHPFPQEDVCVFFLVSCVSNLPSHLPCF